MIKTYCIIGSGVAAVHAAKAIRDQDKEGKILLFGSESSMPYNRIKLSKDLFSDLSSPKVLLKKEKWYAKEQIELLNKTIVKIDTDNYVITTAEGERVMYNKLLICTGAKNRKLPIEGVDMQGVFTIREMHEAEEFKAFVADKQSIINIGGGIQGLETAWSLYQAGKKVSIVEAAPRLMARQLDEKTSMLLKNRMEEMGIKVHLSSGIERIIGEERVEGAITGEKTIACDCIIYSIGVIPNLDLVKNTDIGTNRGIIVNEKMETSVPDVYAAGDVTEFNGEVEGLWGRAMDQGKAAGHNMAANEAITYQKTIPLTVFNAFNLQLFSIGFVDEIQWDTSILEQEGSEKYTRLFIKDSKIVGVISLEGVAASMPYKTAIENQVSIEGMDLKNMTIAEIMTEVKERQQVLS